MARRHTLLAKSRCKMDIWNQPGGFSRPANHRLFQTPPPLFAEFPQLNVQHLEILSCLPTPPLPPPHPAPAAWYNLLWQKGRFKILSIRFKVFFLSQLVRLMYLRRLSQLLNQLDLANSSGDAFLLQSAFDLNIRTKRGQKRGENEPFNYSESWGLVRLLPVVSLTTL